MKGQILLALLERILTLQDIREGRLIRLFQKAVPLPHPYYLLAPPREEMSRLGREVEDWITSFFKSWDSR